MTQLQPRQITIAPHVRDAVARNAESRPDARAHAHMPIGEIQHANCLHAYAAMCECGEDIWQIHGSQCSYSRYGEWLTWDALYAEYYAN